MPEFTILEGDALAVLSAQPDNSFDACLTDPPYGLSETRSARRKSGVNPNATGFMGMKWDAEVPGPEVWAEVLRCLKPGGMLLAFGGSRTHHRLMCAIEDAGFELRDCLMWLYGSGFPKSMDISKALDKAAGVERPDSIKGGHLGMGWRAGDTPSENELGTRRSHTINAGQASRGSAVTTDAATWSGYGTALKPAWEPIILAMKPTDGTFVENALKHGVAGLAIDAGRIDGAPSSVPQPSFNTTGHIYGMKTGIGRNGAMSQAEGRWPANLILDEEAAAALDEQSGTSHSRVGNPRKSLMPGNGWGMVSTGAEYSDSGGASRFFYTAKASSSERGDGNTHPTVKPTELTSYLAKLLLPPERDGEPRRLLVPFSGSGSEIIGALAVGWEFALGIDDDAEYAAIARRRILNDSPLFNAEVAS